jgi:hypothetical protein
MQPNERLIQRLHDGELTQAEVAGVNSTLAQDEQLRVFSQRLSALDELIKAHVTHEQATQTARSQALIERIREKLPSTTPKREVQVSVAHIVAATVLVCFVAIGVILADKLEWILSDVVPMWYLAVLTMMCGMALLVAARPLLRLETGLFNWLLRRRLAVGDGEVLVCRVLGVALIVGGTHIAGVWG